MTHRARTSSLKKFLVQTKTFLNHKWTPRCEAKTLSEIKMDCREPIDLVTRAQDCKPNNLLLYKEMIWISRA